MPARARDCQARVAAVRSLASDVLEADLAMVDPPALAFEPGQWVSVPFGPKNVRAYSIVSTPRSAERITLCADVAPGGLGSRWFRGLAAGDPVGFKGPLGGFVLDPADSRRLLLVAEEIGIVPIRSMLADRAETGAARPATLVYWARDPTWLIYDAELRALSRQSPGFAYHPVAGGAGEPGMAAAAEVERRVTDVSGLVAYVAGGEATITRVRAALMARGLERKAVKWEKFW